MSLDVARSWFEQIPKIELHIHLEGAIPFDALWKLVQKYDGDIVSLEDLKSRFVYTNFAQFIDTWIWKNQFIREYEDFTFIAEAVANNLANQNIYYAEIFFSPPDFFRHGLKTQSIATAIRAGFDKVASIEIALVADLVRDFGPESARITLSEINEVKHLGVIGIGIGGSEKEFPPELFASLFSKARQLGFYTSAHAGEGAGPVSIWGAIRHLHADRIGHGTRAEEDFDLVEYLAKNKIPIEMCPISNVRTNVVESYEKHPVRQYFDQGIELSINTDDPMMFGNSLAEEYALLVEKKGFTPSEIKKLVLAGIKMSWMGEKKKLDMLTRFTEDPAWSVKMSRWE